jgi:hypothetical protein
VDLSGHVKSQEQTDEYSDGGEKEKKIEKTE